MSTELLDAPIMRPSTKSQQTHLYLRANAQFAREAGVEVKAFCGRWLRPNQVDPGSILDTGTGPNLCKHCERGLEQHRALRRAQQRNGGRHE